MELEIAGLSQTLQTAAIASLVFAILVLIPQISFAKSLRNFPAYEYDDRSKKRSTYFSQGKRLYQEGYAKFKEQAWRMTTSEGEDNILIPPKLMTEVKKLPDDVLSFPKAIEQTMHVKYTKLETEPHLAVMSVRADLTPALARLNPIIFAETEQAVRNEMPPCEEWTPVYIYMKLANMIGKISGRVFVGPDLCRDPLYFDTAVNYTVDLIEAQRKIHVMKPWLRPFLAPRLKEIQALRKREQQLKDLLLPIVHSRLATEKTAGADYKRPDDMLQWMITRLVKEGKVDVGYIATTQLSLIFAAIHTTTLTATNTLYSLAVTPEYIQPLREEIKKALADNDGVLTYRALQQMEKLDSYMKEITRFYPVSYTAFSRKVLKPFTLSNGQAIPAGVTIEIPSHAIYQDTENYPDSSTFDGFRFYRLRQQGGVTNHARNQFVTTNEQNLGFGYGRHACPGRFFAANEIKMILARLILEYDFKNADGVTERYPNHEMGRGTSPDPTKALLFKRVAA